MKKRNMILTIFDEGGQQGNGSQGNSGNNGAQNSNGGNGGGTGAGGGGNGTFTYSQLDEIATSRADRASKAALKNFFQTKGLSEAEAETAINNYMEEKKKQAPDVSKIEQERDAARKELNELKNTSFLRDKGVRADDLDYVMFKVGQLVDDKTDFTKAAEKFLKENPRYAGGGSTYRVSTSTQNGDTGSSGNKNTSINDAIRNGAFRR